MNLGIVILIVSLLLGITIFLFINKRKKNDEINIDNRTLKERFIKGEFTNTTIIEDNETEKEGLSSLFGNFHLSNLIGLIIIIPVGFIIFNNMYKIINTQSNMTSTIIENTSNQFYSVMSSLPLFGTILGMMLIISMVFMLIRSSNSF